MRYSVIIPAYNCAGSIKRAYNSVARQGSDDIEIIIVDDGSVDDTPELIRDTAARDSRVKLIFQKNSGPASARNAGLAAADGDYILFLDSDDTFRDGSLKKISAAPEDAKLIIFGFSQNFVQTGSSAVYVPTIPFDVDSYYTGNLLNPVWNKAFKREWLAENNILFKNYRFAEDRIFSADCIKACKNTESDIYILPEVLYNYEVAGKDSLVSSWYPEKFLGCAAAYDVFEELCSSEQAPSYMFIKNLLSCMTVMFAPGTSLTDKQLKSQLCLMLNDNTTRRALEAEPCGGLHIKLLRAIFRLRSPGLACLTGKTVYQIQTKCLPLFIKLK